MATIPLQWGDGLWMAACFGRLMKELARLPRTRWNERSPHQMTMLHYASLGDNVDAALALLSHGLDVNATAEQGVTPLRVAAASATPHLLLVLLAAGANVAAVDCDGLAALDAALYSDPSGECARVLLANGTRLRNAHLDYTHHITPELVAFERGVLRCRAAVVAMLRVKRAGRLVRWDRFLLKLVALDLWTTRSDKGWRAQET